MSLAGQWKQFVDRWVVQDAGARGELYRTEAARIRSGDRLSWALMLTGFVPLALQNPVLAPLWIGLAAGWWAARRRGFTLGPEAATRVSLAVAGIGFAYFAATRNALWAFIVFLVLIATLLVHKADLEVEVPRLYLVAFTLFLVFAHLTLEYTFLVVLFAMVLSGVLVMLRYHFPEEVRPGRYLSTARVLARPIGFAVLLAMPIFVVFPRVPVATLRLTQAPHTAGLGDRVQFGDMAGSLESERVFMTVRTPKGRKWRGVVLDYYDGKGWRRSPRAGKRLEGDGGPIWVEPERKAAGLAGLESAEVILEPTDFRFYLSPQYPVAMENEFGNVSRDYNRALMRNEDPQAKRLRYMVWYAPERASDSQVPPNELPNYLKLLPRFPKSVGELAKRAIGDARTARDKAQAIEKFLAEGAYTYSLGGAPPAGRDPTEWFLIDQKTGHCEYFASAMALMLRTVGVASRVVIGFNPGTFDAYAGTWTVRERNAHAWVEVYLGPEGWVEFDPTTGQGREPVATFAQRLGLDRLPLWQMMIGAFNRVDFEWQRWVVSFSASMQSSLLSSIYQKYEELEIRFRVWWQSLRTARPRAIAGFLVVCAVLWRLLRRPLAWLWRRIVAWLAPLLAWLWRELARARAPKQPELGGFYHELIRQLARGGVAHARAGTPWELGRAVRGKLPAVADAADVVIDAYTRVAYRGQPLTPADDRAIADALARVRAGVATALATDAPRPS